MLSLEKEKQLQLERIRHTAYQSRTSLQESVLSQRLSQYELKVKMARETRMLTKATEKKRHLNNAKLSLENILKAEKVRLSETSFAEFKSQREKEQLLSNRSHHGERIKQEEKSLKRAKKKLKNWSNKEQVMIRKLQETMMERNRAVSMLYDIQDRKEMRPVDKALFGN